MLLFGRMHRWEGFVVTSLRKSGMGLWRFIWKRSWKTSTNITWPKWKNHSFLRFYIGVPLTMYLMCFFLAYITRGVYIDNFVLVLMLICFALSLPRLLFTSCSPSEFHATSKSESEKRIQVIYKYFWFFSFNDHHWTWLQRDCWEDHKPVFSRTSKITEAIQTDLAIVAQEWSSRSTKNGCLVNFRLHLPHVSGTNKCMSRVNVIKIPSTCMIRMF